MLVSGAVTRALDDIATRERDLMQSYSPGAMPQRGDVAQRQTSQFTLDPLSVAPPADAYFVTSDNRGRLLFTRDGSFSMHDGTLVDAQGRPMLGYSSRTATLAPLRVDPIDVALGRVSDPRIESDGSVTYARTAIDPRSGAREPQRVSIGRLALGRFAPGTKLQAVDPQHVTAPAGIAPHIGLAGDGNFGGVTPFASESSGINIDLGLQRLQEAYLALDAIQAADKAKGSIAKTTMDLLK